MNTIGRLILLIPALLMFNTSHCICLFFPFSQSFVNYTPRTEKMEKFHEELSNALWLVRFQLRHGNDLLVLDRLKGFDVSEA